MNSLETQFKVIKLDTTQMEMLRPRFDKILQEMKDDFNVAVKEVKSVERDFQERI